MAAPVRLKLLNPTFGKVGSFFRFFSIISAKTKKQISAVRSRVSWELIFASCRGLQPVVMPARELVGNARLFFCCTACGCFFCSWEFGILSRLFAETHSVIVFFVNPPEIHEGTPAEIHVVRCKKGFLTSDGQIYLQIYRQDHLVPNLPLSECYAGSVQYISNPGNTSQTKSILYGSHPATWGHRSCRSGIFCMPWKTLRTVGIFER